MMKSEFENLAGREVTDEQYRAIETLYMSSNLEKTEFVKSMKPILKNIPQPEKKKDIKRMVVRDRSGYRKTPNGCYYHEKMIATTPPTTEEEQTHCEMIKEAVKGMFINESRTAAEAEFIKTHIVDYEKIFDVCMNGDDLEFKKGLVRLQKMQNEYVMQREND